jgi:hypothetical protein
MASRYIGVEFNDLDFSVKQDLIETIAESIREDWKDQAEQLLKENKNGEAEKYKGKTWQEIICREYDIDYTLWETEEEAREFDWNYAIEEESEEQAENKLWRAFHHLEVEVEL